MQAPVNNFCCKMFESQSFLIKRKELQFFAQRPLLYPLLRLVRMKKMTPFAGTAAMPSIATREWNLSRMKTKIEIISLLAKCIVLMYLLCWQTAKRRHPDTFKIKCWTRKVNLRCRLWCVSSSILRLAPCCSGTVDLEYGSASKREDRVSKRDFHDGGFHFRKANPRHALCVSSNDVGSLIATENLALATNPRCTPGGLFKVNATVGCAKKMTSARQKNSPTATILCKNIEELANSVGRLREAVFVLVYFDLCEVWSWLKPTIYHSCTVAHQFFRHVARRVGTKTEASGVNMITNRWPGSRAGMA